MAWIDKLLKLAQTTDKSRAASLYERLPHIQEAYSPQAVAESLSYAPQGQIIGMRPREFRTLSDYLSPEQAAPYVSHYADLLRNKQWVEPDPDLFMEHYLNTVRNQPFEGFSNVPFLQYKQDPTSKIRGQIMGHEGRHRFLALDDLYGPDLDWPVRISNTHDNLPKHPMMVYPEKGLGPSLDLSRKPRFAGGGLCQMRNK